MNHPVAASSIAGLLVLTLSTAPAAGAPPRDSDPVVVSGASPLSPTCNPFAGAAGRRDFEREPTVAVDPHDRRRIVVAWTQDWGDAVIIAATHDGGSTWKRSVPPALAPGCEHGVDNSALNPKLVVDRDGTVHLLALVDGNPPVRFRELHLASRDGGFTWDSPDVVVSTTAPTGLDWSGLASDPRSGRLLATWTLSSATDGSTAAQVTHSDDAGRTWSTPVTLPADGARFARDVVALDDGSAVATSVDADGVLWVHRSSDAGRTWAPGLAAPLPGSVAAAPGGVLVLAARVPVTASGDAALLQSLDGGRTWGPRRAVPGGPLAAAPYVLPVAVSAEGTIGILQYEEQPDGSDLVILATSRDRGQSWSRIALGGPSDTSTLPQLPSPDDLGATQGLAASQDGFAAAFALARPAAQVGPSDVFVATPKPACCGLGSAPHRESEDSEARLGG